VKRLTFVALIVLVFVVSSIMVTASDCNANTYVNDQVVSTAQICSEFHGDSFNFEDGSYIVFECSEGSIMYVDELAYDCNGNGCMGTVQYSPYFFELLSTTTDVSVTCWNKVYCDPDTDCDPSVYSWSSVSQSYENLVYTPEGSFSTGTEEYGVLVRGDTSYYERGPSPYDYFQEYNIGETPVGIGSCTGVRWGDFDSCCRNLGYSMFYSNTGYNVCVRSVEVQAELNPVTEFLESIDLSFFTDSENDTEEIVEVYEEGVISIPDDYLIDNGIVEVSESDDSLTSLFDWILMELRSFLSNIGVASFSQPYIGVETSGGGSN
jgi:hypothetical protein